MAIPQKLTYTEADYYALPEDVRAELIDGQIYYQAAPSRIHQRLLGKIHQRIANYIDSKSGSCEVYPAPFAVKLWEDRKTIVEPDTTASITPASTAAALKAIDIMIAEPERQENLWKLTNFALEGFRNMGCEIGNTSTPIIPLFIRDNFKTFSITRDLLNEGIFVNPVVSPAVAPQDTLIRFSLMATHSKEQVETALEKIQKVFRAYDLIP